MTTATARPHTVGAETRLLDAPVVMPNEWPMRVRFAEVDSLQVVHHSRYWVWYEEARSQFLHAILGLTPNAIVDLGVALPIIAAECTYGRAVRWGAELVVRVRLEPQRAAKLVFCHELLGAADRSIRYASARTTHVFTDRQLRLRCTVPEPYRQWLATAEIEQPWAFTMPTTMPTTTRRGNDVR